MKFENRAGEGDDERAASGGWSVEFAGIAASAGSVAGSVAGHFDVAAEGEQRRCGSRCRRGGSRRGVFRSRWRRFRRARRRAWLTSKMAELVHKHHDAQDE